MAEENLFDSEAEESEEDGGGEGSGSDSSEEEEDGEVDGLINGHSEESAKESEGENDDEEEEKRKRKKRGIVVLCVHSVKTTCDTFNVLYTRGTEYEDLQDEDYELLQENLGITIAVSLPYTTH